MSQSSQEFPPPLDVPDVVDEARLHRRSTLLSATLWGFILRAVIVAAELSGFYFLDSRLLLIDAIATGVDMISSLLLICCIRIASRPPDEDHPFGHGRLEPIAGMQLGVLMIGAAIYTGLQLLWELLLGDTATHHIHPLAWIIPLIVSIILWACYLIGRRAVKRQYSTAMMAELSHYRVDALNSVVAAIALVAAGALPAIGAYIDQIGALVVAIWMGWLGVRAARENLHQLMDRVPDDHYFGSVRQAAMSVSGVMETEKIRIQHYGPDAHVDIDIEVDPQLPVHEAHTISQRVRRAIQARWPAVQEVVVHIEPYYPGDH